MTQYSVPWVRKYEILASARSAAVAVRCDTTSFERPILAYSYKGTW